MVLLNNNFRGKPILYSTGTELAYRIAKRYYNNVHYVWCSTSFDALAQPGTSNPRTLCNRYLDQISKNDSHAQEINNNKAGILKGADIKLKSGIINDTQFIEIQNMVSLSEMHHFCPVIFIIHSRSAKNRSIKVPRDHAASFVSDEYIIEDLKENEYDLIRLSSILSGVIELDILHNS